MNTRTGQADGQWSALALSFVACIAIFIPYVGYSTQIPQMMVDLKMNYTMVGTLASASALSGGIVVLLAGLAIDRLGAKTVTVAGLLLSSLGMLWFAQAGTYHEMLLARIAQGAAIPLLFVGPYTIAMRWAEQSGRLGIFMGVMLATDGVGTMAATYGYGIILTNMGWRAGSILGAAFLAVVTVIQLIFLREPKAAVVPQAAQSGSLLSNYRTVMLNRNVQVAMMFLIGVWGTYAVAIYWVPTLLIEEAKWSEASAGLVGSLYPFAGIFSSVLFGLISDRLGRRRPLMFLSGIGMVLSFFGAAFAVSTHQYDLLALSLVLAGLFAYGGLPLAYCLSADALGISLAGSANGVIMGTGLVVGGVIYPLVLGYVRDSTGLYTAGFAVAAISLVLFNLLAVFWGRDVKAPLASAVPTQSRV